MTDSILTFDVSGTLCFVTHPDENRPNYQAHIDAHKFKYPDGVTLQIDAATRKQLPEPTNFDGKLNLHGAHIILQPLVTQANKAVGDALQAKMDAHLIKVAAKAQAEADRQAKLQAFKDSLAPDQRTKFESPQSKKDIIGVLKVLSAEQKALAPFDADAVIAADEAAVAVTP